MQQIKRTALLTAACRAKFNASSYWKEKSIHKDVDAEKIVKDLNEFDPILAQFPPGSEEVFGIRFHWQIQKITEKLESNSTKTQIVILGAGMDLSYQVLAKMDIWTHVEGYFEVDLEATQSFKKELALSLGNTDKVTYVNCNFNDESFLEKLKESGWHTELPSVFVWMGVSYYLEEKTVLHSLKLASQAHLGSCLIMDYASPIAKNNEVNSSEEALKSMNEPILFKSHDIASIAAVQGYQKVEQTTFLTELLNHGGRISDISDKRLLKFSVLSLS